MTPDASAYLVRIVLPTACFGLIVRGGVVTEAALIARWSLGKRGRDVVRSYRRRGADVGWSRIEGTHAMP